MTCAQSPRVAPPFGIVVRNVAQPKFTVMAENLPGEIERLSIGFGKHRFINVSHRAKVIGIVSAEVTPRITARTAVQACTLFGNILCLRSDGSMHHGEVSAITDRSAIFSKMIAIGEEEKLERFHLV